MKPLPTIIFSIIALLSAGCSCLRDNIQAELDSNPDLYKRGIRVDVAHINPNGFVYLRVKSGISRDTQCAITRGETLSNIAAFKDASVTPLIEAEQTLKKRPDVKGVTWQAVETCGYMTLEEHESLQDFCPEKWLGLFAVLATLLIAVVGASIFFIVRRKRKTAAAA